MINNANNCAVRFIHVSKEYVMHHEKPTLMEKFTRGAAKKFIALKDLNLTINKGERIGLIGSNGSGKTTFLKICCGITSPTRGSIYTNGKIVSLIDLEAGFHPELTGSQNIYLNGMVLGMSKSELNSKYLDIVKFANIGDFIDTPLYTYSSGMKLRLGFAIAIQSEPDILIIDENISVGDREFAISSYKKIQDMIKNGATLIIASHNIDFIKAYCKKVTWLDKGKIIKSGSTKHVLKMYLSQKT